MALLRGGQGGVTTNNMYTEAIEATGLSYQTARNLKTVSGAFELSRRRDNLSWSHHAEVAALPVDVADELLERAEAAA